jgi:hypothetical protein
MPVRKETTRAKRLNDRTIAALRELIRLGVPWNVDNLYRSNLGVNELRGLVTGHFFFTELCQEDGDQETKKTLYKAVRDEFVPTHAHYQPGARPWAWWEFDAPEPRHLIGRDLDEDEANGHDDNFDRLPAAEDPELPEWAKRMYFGAPACYDGHVYEDEYNYLARLDLLYPEEKPIFKKYDAVINVYIQPGTIGKCAPCWERAREIAKKIGFDLETAIQRFEFWIPGDLYIQCEHHQYNGCGIFVDADY